MRIIATIVFILISLLTIVDSGFSEEDKIVKIIEVHINIEDDYDRNKEYVALEVKDKINLKGWILTDRHGNIFFFPDMELEGRITVYSGEGENTSTELYWNSPKFVWDLSGDVCYLYDEERKEADVYSYGMHETCGKCNIY